ncbi:hypothetical protein GLOIN_2v1869568 [Rhizophagus irregularis DAOM 181602=DAOM 197198]|nr:hypothetical protein GLOIN_2v1869568 [Rhizophagus irregularis DAOM 181602=DAOM 197198]
MIKLNDDKLNCEQAIIDKVGQDDVLKIWKVVDIQNEKKNHVHYVIIVNVTISFLYSCLKLFIRGIYIEQEDNEITIIFQDYIRRKSNQNTPEISPALDEIPTIDERPAVDATDKISSNPQEI